MLAGVFVFGVEKSHSYIWEWRTLAEAPSWTLTTQDRWSMSLKYISDTLQTEEVFTVEEYTYIHTHTHTHKHTHKHTHTYTQCPVSQALKIPECWFLKTLPRMTRTLKKTDIFSWNIWSKYLNSQVSSVTLIFRLLYQLSKIAKKYTKLTYITC